LEDEHRPTQMKRVMIKPMIIAHWRMSDEIFSYRTIHYRDNSGVRKKDAEVEMDNGGGAYRHHVASSVQMII
jgi:hypothetical protein